MAKKKRTQTQNYPMIFTTPAGIEQQMLNTSKYVYVVELSKIGKCDTIRRISKDKI